MYNKYTNFVDSENTTGGISMHIKEIVIRNFRILSDSRITLDMEPCLMIGRNNAGKTSFMVLMEKFLRGQGFTYADFPVRLRDKILNMDMSTDETELAIRLLLTIQYEENDDLRNLSDFIVDLEPNRREVYLLFECGIHKVNLLSALQQAGEVDRKRFIRKHLSDHLKTRIYTFDDPAVIDHDRTRMVEKTLGDVTRLIDFEIIHAKRNVASSEERNGRQVLSRLTTSYFNSQNSSNAGKFEEINNLISTTDKRLDSKYNDFFSGFLKSAKDYLDIGTLKVQSNLSAKEILEDASEVVYGDDISQLPEHQNGLGHVNILYLLLSIEIKKRSFEENKKDIKLLFIEEPEAHTHPQLQYNFAREINKLVGKKQGIQTIITTHSPHIVASYPFENLRYMSVEKDAMGPYNVQIKHFHTELQKQYSDKKEFQFLKQYLTVVSSELFFADKAIFIEGTSEVLLLPYFISRFDKEQLKRSTAKQPYVPMAAQNIAVVQAGANAKVFQPFLQFLGIPALIITDLDTVRKETGGKRTTYPECKVTDIRACNTSNATIKFYLEAPNAEIGSTEYQKWFESVRDRNIDCVRGNVRISYQCKENGFQARSFEDAFLNVNLTKVKKYWPNLDGLQNKKKFDAYVKNGPQSGIDDIYDLTEAVLKPSGKSDLASSLLYLSYAEGVEWETPLYIKEGLEWLQKQTQ